ncbi:MOSC domain-containing protein [Acidihalobacter ferrooxydans]|uniref:MOSC domain-containing protein n=1 Tax=Acidihalobacter ferrooxydans TaxID=1765967 RepID=A0A1P8UKV1_9GAMM|nr:MOSC N-terminal beta barrel domain-containing protein [Acidihalobacter ferrooxydans]APZ44477.1 hypothetical protein BW247_01455 [Acidihalobacter ferrooxydans]
MLTHKQPVLERIRIYPLKSFDGMDVAIARVLPVGALASDRRFALCDAGGAFLNGKRDPRVHAVRIAWRMEADVLCFDATVGQRSCHGRLPEDAERLGEWFSAHFGQELTVVEDTQRGYPDDTDAHGPTVVATASIERVAAWLGEPLARTRRRFRANLEIGGVPAFWEDGLLGEEGAAPGRFLIGDVEFQGLKPCVRCPVPTRDPDTGVADSRLPRVFSAQRRTELPDWAPQSRFTHYYRFTLNTGVPAAFSGGELHVGDALREVFRPAQTPRE